MLLSDGIQLFILHIKKKGFVTRNTQDFYDSMMGYYAITWKLREKGIIRENGRDNRNQKVFVLTENGLEIVKDIKDMRKRMGEKI